MLPFLQQQWPEVYHHQQHQDAWNVEQHPPPLLDSQPSQPPHSKNQSHIGSGEGEQDHEDHVELSPQDACNGLEDLGRSSVASEVPMVSECATYEESAKTDTEHDEKQIALVSCGEAASALPDQETAKEADSKSLTCTPVETSPSTEEATSEAAQLSPKTQPVKFNQSRSSAVHCDCTTVGVQVDMHDCVDEDVQCTPSVADRSCQVSLEDLPQQQDALREQLDVRRIVHVLVSRMKGCGLTKVGEERNQFLKAMSVFEDRLKQDIDALLEFAPVGTMPHTPYLTEMDEAVCPVTVEEQCATVGMPPMGSKEEDEANDLEVSHINKVQEDAEEPQGLAQFDVVSPPSGSSDINASPSFDSPEINAPSCTAEMASGPLLDSFSNRTRSPPPPVRPFPASLPDSSDKKASSPLPLIPAPVLDSSDKKASSPLLPVRPAFVVSTVNTPAANTLLSETHQNRSTEQALSEVNRLIEESKAGTCRKRQESLSPISDEEFEEYNDDGNAKTQPTKPPLRNHTHPHDVDNSQKNKVCDPNEASSMSNSHNGARHELTATSVIGSTSVVKDEPSSAFMGSGDHEPQAYGTSLEMGPPTTPLSHYATPSLKEGASEVSEGNSVEPVTTGVSPTLTANTPGTVSQKFKRKTHLTGSSLSLSSLLGDSNSKAPSSTKSEAKADDAEVSSSPSMPKKLSQWSTFMHPNWIEKDSELPFKSHQPVDPAGAKKKKKKKKKSSDMDRHVDSVLEQFQEDSAKGGVLVVSNGPQQSAIESSKSQQWKYGGTLHSVDGKQKPAGAKGEKSNTSPRKAEEKHNGNDHPTTHSDSDSSRHNGRTRRNENSTEHSSSSGRSAPTYKKTLEKRVPSKSYSPRRHYSSEDSRHSRSGRDRSRSRSPRRSSIRRASSPSHQYPSKKGGLGKRRYSRSPPRAREKSLDLSSSYHSATSEDESPRSKRYRSASELDQQSSIEPLSSRKWNSLNKYSRDEPSASIFDSSDPKRIVNEWFDSSSTSASDTALGCSLPQSSLWDNSPQVLAEDGFDSGRYSRSVTPPQAPEPRHLVPIQPYISQ